MSKIQIDEDIFLLLYKQYCMNQEPTTNQKFLIKSELENKMSKILSRMYYSNYKNCSDEDDKKNALEMYIKQKKGLI